METLNLMEATVYDGQQPLLLAKHIMSQEMIEISSDEEDQEDQAHNGQPESSNRSQPWMNFKRASAAASEPNNQYMDTAFSAHDPEYARPKRQKLNDHGSSKFVQDAPPPAADLPDSFMDDVQQSTNINDSSFAHRNIFVDAADFFENLAEGAPEDQAWLENAIAMLPPDFHQPLLESALPQNAIDRKGKNKVKAGLPLEPTPAPYYDDPKFEVRMYCGPGYEKFPIVLGTIPEHKEICRKWDRKNIRRLAQGQTDESAAPEVGFPDNSKEDDDIVFDDSDGEDDQNTESTHKTEIELECLKSVVEVLPDIKRDFVLKIIRKFKRSFKFDANEEIEVHPSSADIVAEILDLPEYPKQEAPESMPRDGMDGTGVTIQWQKGDIDSKAYQRDAVCLLAGQFDHIPTHFIFKTVQDKRSLIDSYLHLNDLEASYLTMNAGERPYRRTHDARKVLEKKYTSRGRSLRLPDQWDNLVNELQAAKQRIEREEIKAAKRKQAEELEAANFAEHKARGDIVECQCCFDDEIPLNRAISCEGTQLHWFCFGCVVRLAENQIGSMKHQMKCMHSSGCDAALSPSGINEAVPTKLYDKLAFYKQQFEISEACIEGLEQCPFCDFKAICDPVEEDPTFRCQNPECRRVSCRKCHENGHLPKSCEEAKKDKGLSARHRIEEARSEAMMRPCPQCKVKIIKELGCNKMKCSKCGCVMCYVCKADISNQRDHGYDHFNRRGAKCNLYDKGLDRHDREADEAEREAIKKVREENADLDEKQLQIETGLAKKPASKPKQADAPRRNHNNGLNRAIPYPNGRLIHVDHAMIPNFVGNGAAPEAFYPDERRHNNIGGRPHEVRDLGRYGDFDPQMNAAGTGRMLHPAPLQLVPWGMEGAFMHRANMGDAFPFEMPDVPQVARLQPVPGFPRWDNPWEQLWNQQINDDATRRPNMAENTRPGTAGDQGEVRDGRVKGIGAVGGINNDRNMGTPMEFDRQWVNLP